MMNAAMVKVEGGIKEARKMAEAYRGIGRKVRIFKQTGTFQVCDSPVSKSGAYTFTHYFLEVK